MFAAPCVECLVSADAAADAVVALGHLGGAGGDGVLVVADGALHAAALVRVQAEAEGVDHVAAQLLHVGDPVADALDVERASRHHVGAQSLCLCLFQCADELKHLADAEVGLDAVDDARDDARQARQDGGGGYGVDARAHEFLLAFDAADVALLVAVADVCDGGLAVHVLASRAQVDDEAAVVVPRILVVHALFDVDVDAADGVDDLLEGVGVDDDVVIHADAEEVLDGALGEFFATVGVCRVDFVVAVFRDGDARVTRDGEERGLVFLRVDGRDHESVAASDVVGALINAHDHDGRLVLGGEQFVLRGLLGAVEQAALGKEDARECRKDEDEDRAEHDVGPSFLFRRRSLRW